MIIWPKILRLVGLTLILSGFIFLIGSRADGPSLSGEAYWQKLQQTKTVVEELAEETGPGQQARRLELAAEWAQIRQVRPPAGPPISVDHTALVTLLRADSVDLPELAARLEALLATRAAWPPPRHTPADLTTLESILARPEFQWPAEERSLLAEWWAWLAGKLWELTTWLMPDEALLSFNEGFVNYALTVLGSIALLLALFFALRELLFNLAAEAEVSLAGAAGDEALTADTAFKKAQTLSSGGDYRTAVRYLYLSSLLILDERGLLRYDRAQTNREYLRHVAHLPHLAAILREVIDVFDRVWYGYQPLDEATYNKYAARVAELRRHR